MNRYVYVFYRYSQKDTSEYSSYEDALCSFVCDFWNGEAYGMGIYDKESKILHLPDHRFGNDDKEAIKEIEKLGYEVLGVHFFNVPDWEEVNEQS